jgi:hypothetical protein
LGKRRAEEEERHPGFPTPHPHPSFCNSKIFLGPKLLNITMNLTYNAY